MEDEESDDIDDGIERIDALEISWEGIEALGVVDVFEEALVAPEEAEEPVDKFFAD